MKTHKARWYQNSPSTWILKEPSRDGGAVLATIARQGDTPYTWRYQWIVGAAIGESQTYYAAQRAARKALRDLLNEQ